MVRYSTKIALALAGLFIALTGCRKGGNFPDTPALEWRSHELKKDQQSGRNSIDLTVFFTDGDGDVGYTQKELAGMDSCDIKYNLLINYFEKVDGRFEEIQPTDPCLPFHNLVPDIRQEGQNPTLEGTITTTFSYLGLPRNSGIDSVKFEIQLIDRSGKESNVITSPAIYVSPL